MDRMGKEEGVYLKKKYYQSLVSLFPGLETTPWDITSKEDTEYNCIAWAAGDNENWWWPDLFSYWPEGIKQECTFDSFEQAFGTMGFIKCKDGSFEPGFEKIAIFTDEDNIPLHAARQINDGTWTSKLGRSYDITHTETALLGKEYGRQLFFLKRKTKKIDCN